MKLRLIILIALLIGPSACSPHPPPAHTDSAPEIRQWNRLVHQRLNDYRRDKGLAPLAYHDGLEQLCTDHSRWLRRERGSSFLIGSHVSHSGSGYRARYARIQFGMSEWDENVAYISQTPEDIAAHLILMWRASPPHQKVMLGDWTHSGVGISVDDDGAVFVTMNFGSKTPV